MKKIYVVCLFLLLTSVQLYAGGPWANGKGHGYAQMGISLNYYNSIFYNGGKMLLNRAVHDNTYQVYGEYGITNKLSVVGVVPFKFLRSSEPPIGNPTNLLASGSLNAFGNISVAGKYTFYDKNVHIAFQLLIESNTHSLKNEIGLRTGYNAWAAVPSILAGASSNKFYGFFNAGYAFRSNGYSEELRADLEVGYEPIKKLSFAIVFNNKISMKNGVVAEGNVNQTAMYVNNQAYNAFGIKLAKGIGDKMGINMSAYGAFAGNWVAAAPTFNGGVYYKW